MTEQPALRFWTKEHCLVILPICSDTSDSAVSAALQAALRTVTERRPPQDEVFSLTSNHYEHSLVIPEHRWISDVRAAWPAIGLGEESPRVQGRWAFFRIDCPPDGLDFGIVGLLHRILTVLTTARVSILAVGTYLTDYVLLDIGKVKAACEALTAVGWPVFLDGVRF